MVVKSDAWCNSSLSKNTGTPNLGVFLVYLQAYTTFRDGLSKFF